MSLIRHLIEINVLTAVEIENSYKRNVNECWVGFHKRKIMIEIFEQIKQTWNREKSNGIVMIRENPWI